MRAMEKLKILWFNWRCIKHPLAGGAEVYTHEIAKRLTLQGHDIVLVTSRANGLPPEESIDGYKVIRRGGRYSVYLKTKGVYKELKKRNWKPDVVIDEVNTIPFFTPLYVEEPIVMLIHQLCKDCWRYAFHPILEKPGWFIEKAFHRIYIKAIHKEKVKLILTVSESTKQDLVSLGYPENRVSIVYNGLDWDFYNDCIENAKYKDPLVVYIGRITPYKRLEDLVEAWRCIEQEHSDARLVIAGRAEERYLRKLIELIRKYGLKRVEVKVNIPREEKKMLLARASILVYTSIREGWGQTVLEAAACLTPTIAYNVPGLRDSVKHRETGILVTPRNIDELAKAILYLLLDTKLRRKLAENAYRVAKNYTWDRTASQFIQLVHKVISYG